MDKDFSISFKKYVYLGMKRYRLHVIICILLLVLITGSCSSSSRKNELIYRFEATDPTVPFDSLKSEILDTPGAEMLVVYPDSDVVIIHYDRFRTHQDIIEKQFLDCGYKITLLEKNKIEEKNQPWQKKSKR